MPNRVKISTKTTRKKEFNSYQTNIRTEENPLWVTNTVTSTTATKDNPNIKLLDVNEKIEQLGKDIADYSADNTTLIEMTLQVDHKKALELYSYVGNHPTEGQPGYATYKYYSDLLAQNGMEYDDIGNWIATYEDGVTVNTDADIQFHNDNDTKYAIYGAPEQQVLNNRQHYNNCGIESTLNNLIMAGIIKMNDNLKDQEKVEKSFLKAVWDRNLAGDSFEIGTLDKSDGGTRPDDYRDIMKYYGINSKSYYITTKSDANVYERGKIKELAYKISQGYGAIIGVSSDKLWKNVQSEGDGKTYKIDHAIALIGVVYENGTVPSKTADPVGFFIHDTGGWMTKFISYDEFLEATLCDYLYNENDDPENYKLSSLREYDSRLGTYIEKKDKGIFVTLTDEPIKVNPFNLNVTGDKYANILWGNNSNNIVKGMNGNDTLYGRGGNDSIYGGNGDDIIIGNEALNVSVEYDLDTLTAGNDTFTFNTYTDFSQYLDDTIAERLDNLDSKEITGDKVYTDLTEMYRYILASVPEGLNTIDGGAGDDIIIGGEQADLIYGGKGKDYIYGGDGRNAIYGGAGNDLVIGGYDSDRLFGDAGNDTIYGLDDEDVIDGGAGNDHLWGGGGSDMIETGKGNDTVYFEGTEFGQDQISSKAGSTMFKFVADGDTAASKVTDLFFTLEAEEDNDKVKNLNIQYRQGDIEDDESGIALNNYYTVKSGKTKSLYVDSDADGMYTVSVSKRATATVANTKTNGTTKIYGENIDNDKINNILMTTYEGATITTSDKNDIVTMVNNENPLVLDMIADKITYTKGKDKYVSEDRNTYYTVGAITGDTNLSIHDNVIGITKVTDPTTEPATVDKNYASKDDRLYTTTASDDLNFFFDVKKGATANVGYTTSNGGFYLLDNSNMNDTSFTTIANGNELGNGFIYMDSFFGYDKEHDTGYEIVNSETPDFYGNGRIEHIVCDNSEFYYTESVANIASAVADWLADKSWESAFAAFADTNPDKNIEGLIDIYMNQGQTS